MVTKIMNDDEEENGQEGEEADEEEDDQENDEEEDDEQDKDEELKIPIEKILKFWQFQKIVLDFYNTILQYPYYIYTKSILYGAANQMIFRPGGEGNQKPLNFAQAIPPICWKFRLFCLRELTFRRERLYWSK